MTRRIWQNCASQIFDWHGFSIVLIFAGEQGYLIAGTVLLWLGRCTTLVEEIDHLVEEMVYLGGGNCGVKKKNAALDGNVLTFNALKL